MLELTQERVTERDRIPITRETLLSIYTSQVLLYDLKIPPQPRSLEPQTRYGPYRIYGKQVECASARSSTTRCRTSSPCTDRTDCTDHTDRTSM